MEQDTLHIAGRCMGNDIDLFYFFAIVLLSRVEYRAVDVSDTAPLCNYRAS